MHILKRLSNEQLGKLNAIHYFFLDIILKKKKETAKYQGVFKSIATDNVNKFSTFKDSVFIRF